MMNHHAFRIFLVCQLVLGALFLPTIAAAVSQPEAQEAEPEKGPHRGRGDHRIFQEYQEIGGVEGGAGASDDRRVFP